MAINDAKLDALVKAEMDELIRIRHDLHAHPQIAFEETYASGVVAKELESLGIDHVTGVAKTGVVGWLQPKDAAGKPDTAVGLRADMDALPITEETGLEYASLNTGCMHACGHDGHTTVLIGAARVLNQLKELLPRPVKFVFQPAEEQGSGAEKMIEAGVLEDTIGPNKVAAMFGLHGLPELHVGHFAVRPGPIMAAVDVLRIFIEGRGGHAAFPQNTRDPIVAAAAVINAAQTIVSRNINATDAAVLSITAIHGGEAYNVIPPSVELRGTIRTLNEETVELARQRLREIVETIAGGYGCKGRVEILDSFPVTVNDPEATTYMRQTVIHALGSGNVIDLAAPVMGGEDFAYFTEQVPSCFGFIGVRPQGMGEYPTLHNPRFDFTDDAIAVGVKLMCHFALNSNQMPED